MCISSDQCYVLLPSLRHVTHPIVLVYDKLLTVSVKHNLYAVKPTATCFGF